MRLKLHVNIIILHVNIDKQTFIGLVQTCRGVISKEDEIQTTYRSKNLTLKLKTIHK